MHHASARRGAPADLARPAASPATRRLGPSSLCDGRAGRPGRSRRCGRRTSSCSRPGRRTRRRRCSGCTRRGIHPSQLFFITGADAFAEIATWRHYPHFLDAAHFVVVDRPGRPATSMRERAARARAAHARCAARQAAAANDSSGRTVIFLVNRPTPDVSSTGDPRALCRRTADHGAGAARRGTAHRSSCALSHPRCERFSRRRRRPVGEPVA